MDKIAAFISAKFSWVVLASVVFSLGLKISAHDHSLQNLITNDIQHVFTAYEGWMIKEGTKSADPQARDAAAKSLAEFWKRNHKYPLGLTRVYMMLSERTRGLDKIRADLVKKAREFNVFLFGTLLVLIWLLPLDRNIRMGAVVLACLSLMIHHYTMILRIHYPTGVVVFASTVAAIRSVTGGRPWVWIPVASLLAGIAAGFFFTGALAFYVILWALVLLWRSKVIPRWQVAALLPVALVIFVWTMTPNHPVLADSLGEGKLTTNEQFKSYFGAGDKGSKSVYAFAHWKFIHDITGMEPLLGIGALLGLYGLWKTKKWKEPVWLMILGPSLSYLFVMGCMRTNSIRRTTVVAGFLAVIAAYGWGWLIKNRAKVGRPLLAALSILAIAAIFRHATLTHRDTRSLVWEFAQNHIPPGPLLLVDDLGPHFGSSLPGRPSSIRAASNRDYVWNNILGQSHVREQAHNAGLTSKTVQTPEGLIKGMQLFGMGHYVWNRTWANHTLYVDLSRQLHGAQMVAQFQPRLDQDDGDIGAWPNCDKNLLHLLWDCENVGPTIEIWQMPWAQFKMQPVPGRSLLRSMPLSEN